MSSSGTSRATPTAAAASALTMLCRPAKAILTGCRLPPASSVNARPSSVSVASPAMRTVAPAARPKVMTRPFVSRAIEATRGSSALSTATPVAESARTSAAFSSRTPSMLPRNSVWTAATIVTTPTVGRAMAESVAISPGWLVPSSTTAARCSAPSRRSVSGRPHWLLNDEAGLSTSPRVASTAAVSSFTVVLPIEPVMATTGTLKRERCQAARRPSERVVSSTRTSGTWEGGSSGSVCTTTHAAPRTAASARKAWPSSRWPTIAKNASPTWSVRESIDTPAMGTARSPLTSAPSVARTSSWMLNAAIRLPIAPAPTESAARPRGRRTAAPRSRRSGTSRAPCRR